MFWRLVKTGGVFQLISFLITRWVWSHSIWWGMSLLMTWGLINLFWILLLVAASQRRRTNYLLKSQLPTTLKGRGL